MVSTPSTWPDYVATMEQGLSTLEDGLDNPIASHEPLSEFAIDVPAEPIPVELRVRLALLARRLEHASARVALEMLDLSSRSARTTSSLPLPMFIDQHL